MSNYDEAFYEALQKVYEILEKGEKTEVSNWAPILDKVVGNSDLETISNIQRFVEKKFSFEIVDGAEGYVYYGKLNKNNGIYQVVNEMVKSTDGSYR